MIARLGPAESSRGHARLDVIFMFFAAAFVGQTIGWLVVWSANKGPFHRLQ